MRFFTIVATALAMAVSVIGAPANEVNAVSFKNGKATYYDPSVGTGSCGTRHSKEEFVAALPISKQGVPPTHCGEKATVTNLKNGKSVTVTIVDSCAGCDGKGAIVDLSEGAFKYFNDGSLTAGIIDVSMSPDF